MLNFVLNLIQNVYPLSSKAQWATVNTNLLLINEPPHLKSTFPLSSFHPRAAMCGNSAGSAFVPPTIKPVNALQLYAFELYLGSPSEGQGQDEIIILFLRSSNRSLYLSHTVKVKIFLSADSEFPEHFYLFSNFWRLFSVLSVAWLFRFAATLVTVMKWKSTRKSMPQKIKLSSCSWYCERFFKDNWLFQWTVDEWIEWWWLYEIFKCSRENIC